MTVALNILGLTVPIAAQLVFNRILPNPHSATLPVIVAGGAVLAGLEACLRFCRSYTLYNGIGVRSAALTTRLFSQLVRSGFEPGERGSARSLDYFTRISQVAEKSSGQTLVAMLELMFLPIILLLILYISPVSGVLVTLCLAAGVWFTLQQATRLQRTSNRLNRKTERRYRFLLSVLGSIHPLKALAIEDYIQRRYEAIQADIARTSLTASNAASKLMNGTVLINQVILGVSLAYGAYSASNGNMTLGAVAAIILLGGRLVGPMQRAVFILIQSRDMCEAETTLSEAFALTPRRALELKVGRAEMDGEGRLDIEDLEFISQHGNEQAHYGPMSLHLSPGETIAISGAGEVAQTKFLHCLAGISDPMEGRVLINGADISMVDQQLLNRCVAYVPPQARMFKGTIRDNITRFGEVSLDEAMLVAGMMSLNGPLSELPRGVDTPLTGELNENIPAGLCQQLAILRALALRPRILLLHNIDRGLDRQGYDRLQRFLGRLQGQVTLMIVSDDLNLTSGAQRSLILTQHGFSADMSRTERQISAYRSLRL
ncbi:ABC transporter transmembrane domain-containing protein [Roseibium sp.]|uniref:ABC transporter transmembrane domain-containing protein n=1 Tax=Roseibium sp. TaxID=1936156 RepID=UPI003D10256D